MKKNDGKDYIYVIWKEPNERRRYIIGELVKGEDYEFSYNHEIEDAVRHGFNGFICFKDLKKTYRSNFLFPAFSSRLPDERRKGIEEILERYELSAYDSYELLKRSGAKLPTDNFEFINPLPENFETETLERHFYIAGSRYYIGCEQKNCEKAVYVELKDKLTLNLEPTNESDKYAIKVYHGSNHLGYIPRYYSQGLTKFIKNKYEYHCEVSRVNKDKNCNECIEVKIVIMKV